MGSGASWPKDVLRRGEGKGQSAGRRQGSGSTERVLVAARAIGVPQHLALSPFTSGALSPAFCLGGAGEVGRPGRWGRRGSSSLPSRRAWAEFLSGRAAGGGRARGGGGRRAARQPARSCSYWRRRRIGREASSGGEHGKVSALRTPPPSWACSAPTLRVAD